MTTRPAARQPTRIGMCGDGDVRIRQKTMRAAQLIGERKIALTRIADPEAPAPDEITVQIRAVALNHIDVWSWRGMAFAKRALPIVLGAEASGEVIELGCAVKGLHAGDIVALYGARTCGTCEPCRNGQDNFCEGPRSMYGFNIDGFLRERMNIPARLAIKAPEGLDAVAAACAPITFGTVEHMLFDNAKLKAGETILIQAGGSGIGTAAIQLAKAVGAIVITTVGSDEKAERVRALGADHTINYRRERFEGRVRQITNRKGVDVVFEHVGADTWDGSILSLSRGGRLVTCGSTTGVAAKTNLYLLFQQQLRLIGSFGCKMENMKSVMGKLAQARVSPIIDSIIALEHVEEGLQRLESRNVFGKIIVRI